MFLLNPFIYGSGSGGGLMPEGATAHLDFINGYYWAGGAQRAVSDVLGDGPDTVQAGGGFNPDAIVPAKGLLICNNGNVDAETSEAWTNRPYPINTLYDDMAAGLLAGCTMVFEFNCQNPPYGTLFAFYDDISENDSFDWVDLEIDYGLTDGYDVSIVDEPTGTGLHKIAVTLNRDVGAGNRQYAMSIDGGAASTADIDYSDPFPTASLNTITIGHDGDDSKMLDIVYLRTITLYPAVEPTELPALSSPS